MFEQVLVRDSVSVEAKLRIGEAYFAQLQSDSTLTSVARSMFERIRDRHKNDWRPYWFLGAIGSISRDDSLTTESFRKVTELAPWNPDGWGFLASVYLRNENFEEAARILEEGLRHVPDDYQINLYLGIAYNQLQRVDEAILALERANSLNPADLRALTQLALIYDARKDIAASDSLYEEALKIEPDNHLVLNNYGYSLAERGIQLERALDMATRALKAQPDNASYLDTMGWVYYKLGNFAEAEKFVKQSLAAGEQNAVVLEHLGDIYYMSNRKDLALDQWNKALQLDEGNQTLREKISRGGL
jgi:tetratricopeptide (TPR) repeat protein